MRIIESENDIGFITAAYVKKRINEAGGRIVLGLPTGGTMESFYRHLVEFCAKGELSFKEVVTFNLDEYIGLRRGDKESYRSYMNSRLFDMVDIEPANIHFPDVYAEDLEKAGLEYDKKIESYGGIDIFLGGVGRNGHIAFNEAGTPFDAPTHKVELSESTRKANSRFFNNDINAVPKYAFTMGMGTILKSREIIILASGEKKSEALYRAVEGPVSAQWPISALRLHNNSYIVADPKALSQVSTAGKKRFAVCSFGGECQGGCK